MLNARTKAALHSRTGETKTFKQIWFYRSAILAVWASTFCACYVFEQFVPPAPMPFFPANFCLAFADPVACPVNASIGCGPCHGELCACPCPYGVCPAGIVSPCPPAGNPPADVGYGNTTAPGGPVCPTAVISPGNAGINGGRIHDCPTGLPPDTDLSSFPPVFRKLTPEEYCEEICPANLCGRGALNEAQQRSFEFIAVMEKMYFGLGIAFAVFVGPPLFRLRSGDLKNSVLIIYVILCFLVISWYPHIFMHGYYTTNHGLLSIDLGLHWPIAFGSLFLLRYVYKMLSISSIYKRPSPKNLLEDIRLHVIVITVVIGVVCFVFQYPPFGLFDNQRWPTLTDNEKGAFSFIAFVEAHMFGGAIAFLYCITPVLHGLREDRTVLAQAIPLVISMAWLVGSWYWHILMHNTTPVPFSPSKVLGIEFAFHWGTQIFSLIVVYNMHEILQLAVNLQINTNHSHVSTYLKGSKADEPSSFQGKEPSKQLNSSPKPSKQPSSPKPVQSVSPHNPKTIPNKKSNQWVADGEKGLSTQKAKSKSISEPIPDIPPPV